MLESLTLKNFEAYKKAVLLFHKGVNVIVGETDHGKSSIIRALKWVFENKPSGEEFLSYWGNKDTFVKVAIDGENVRRVRGKENSYYLNKSKFVSFGTGVPDEVRTFFNLSDINIQSQLDSHFLLSESSGEVARYLNKIVNLDVIDRSLSTIQRDIQDEKRKLNSASEEKKELEESLKEYDWLGKAEVDLKKLENLDRTINSTYSTITVVGRLMEEIDQLSEERSNLLQLFKAKEEVDQLGKQAKKIEDQQQEYLSISRCINQVEDLLEEKQKKQKEKDKLHEEFDKLMPDKCPLCGK